MKVKFLKGLTVAGVIAAAVKVVFLLLAGQVGREVGKEVYPATSNAHDTDYYKSHPAELAAAINTNMMLPQVKTTEDGTRMRMEPVAAYGQTINYSYIFVDYPMQRLNEMSFDSATYLQQRLSYMRQHACSKQVRDLFDQGYVYRYAYYSADGQQVAAFDIGRADCIGEQ